MKKLDAADLAQFSGGDVRYRHMLGGLLYTEGVQFMAEQAGAYWLIDAVASYQGSPKLRKDVRLRDFQLWELKVQTDLKGRKSCVLTCKADSGTDEKVYVRQRIEYTDFPLDSIKLYIRDNVLMLPSEY